MDIIIPKEITETELLSSTAPLNDYPVYDSGTTYDVGDRVLVDIEVYESLKDGNDDDPLDGVVADPPTWLRLGYANRWRMFRDGPDSKTVYSGDIVTDILMGSTVSGLALLDLVGLEVTVIMTDPIEGEVYNETRLITDPNVGDWWSFYFAEYSMVADHVFMDLPLYIGATIEITITALSGGDAEAGRVVIGNTVNIGDTQLGVATGIQDYTQRTRDGFGNITIVPRRSVKRADYTVVVDTQAVPQAQRTLQGIASVPAVFVGDENRGNTIIFGLYRDFTITIDGMVWSTCSIDVEGF